MNVNHRIHITIASIGLFISTLLAITGMFILPQKATEETGDFYNVVAYTGIALFIVYAIYLTTALCSKGKSELIPKKFGKFLVYAILVIGALGLIIGGIAAAFDLIPLGAGLIMCGIVLMAVVIDLIAESAPGSNKFIARLSIGIGTLLAIAIISVFLFI